MGEAPAELLRRAGLEGGVQVSAVDSASDGARAGLEPGDVITKINLQPVTNLDSYRAIVGKLKPGDPVVLRIWRRGEGQTPGETQTLEIPALSE